jgi:hypothetical protein
MLLDAARPVVAQAQIPTLRQLQMLSGGAGNQEEHHRSKRGHVFQMDPVRFGMRRQNVGYVASLKKVQRKVKEGDLMLPYGHRSYEFKMETPVLVIGATLDDKLVVDMNLARITDGAINYVEERQAVIKLERDGEFYIRNIGKQHVIKLDGREIQPNGDTRRLHDQNIITVSIIDFLCQKLIRCKRLAKRIFASMPTLTFSASLKLKFKLNLRLVQKKNHHDRRKGRVLNQSNYLIY